MCSQGPYSVKITVVDEKSTQLFCEKMNFRIEKKCLSSSDHWGWSGLFRSAKSWFGLKPNHAEVGELLDAADQAWNLKPETKTLLRRALMEGHAFADGALSSGESAEEKLFLQ